MHPQACIFKVGDDVRQDMLALQIIDLLKRILDSVGLNLFLYPYRVIATSSECGIIECVPHAKSRDELGKQVDGSLYEYFLQRYGHANSVEFQNARNNFLRSMAAYSVASYILQIKDRHNGNMMIDDFGHIVHIDFGFIFDIAPGGNHITFEKSPFKLSTEMLDLMGGKLESAPFKAFMRYCTQAYLAVREHSDSIVTLVALMMDTTLPCFSADSLANLKSRLSVGKSERDGAKHMTYVISQACNFFSAGTTYVYDVFQAMQNHISY
eukprot:TRINITY_DN4437_c0_g1_i1.p1 TRINITY_DN4437_c0_g1~~TRINITY_DN4437_c0_g1_i1.p1  ORF type:complete len:313 (+),score=145.29 TRINITY_DN4437_c0_g1_i1:141-941(+)